MVSAPQKREGARVLKARRIPERRIAALIGISRSGMRYRIRPKPQDHLAERVKALSAEHPRYGQVRIWALLRRADIVVNHKAVSRLWQKLGLQLTRRPKRKKVRSGDSVPRLAEHPNHVWTYDFVFAWTLGWAASIRNVHQRQLSLCIQRGEAQPMPLLISGRLRQRQL